MHGVSIKEITLACCMPGRLDPLAHNLYRVVPKEVISNRTREGDVAFRA